MPIGAFLLTQARPRVRGYGLRLAGILSSLLPGCPCWGQGSPAPPVGAPTAWRADPVLSPLLLHQLVPDSTGYLWGAADDGVRRYDGYAAVPLARLVRGRGPVPTGYCFLAVDRAGRLWIGSAAGLAWLDTRTGRLSWVPLPTAPAERPDVSALWLDARTGRLWVSYGGGRVLTFAPEHPPQPGAAPAASPTGGSVVQTFAPSVNGEVWVTADQLVVFEANGRMRRRYPRTAEYVVPVPGTRPLQLLSATALYELAEATGRLRERQRWLPPGPYDARFFPLRDVQGRPCEWLASGRHLTLSWPKTGAAAPQLRQLPLLSAGTPEPRALHPERLYQLSRDQTGLEWAISLGWRGSFRQGPPQLVQALPEARPTPNPSVRGLTRLPDGRLLVSTYAGTRTQAADSPQAPLRPLPVQLGGRPWAGSFYHLLATRAGRVLFALEVNGFGELDVRTGEATEWPPAPGHPAATQIRGRTLHQDRRGTVWGGGGTGLYQLDETRHLVRRYRNADPTWPLHQCEVRGISEDAAGWLWLATSRGLYAFDPATDALRHYGPDEAAPARRLPVADLTCVLAGPPGGRVWVGTRAAGLLALAPGRGLVQRVGPEQGLPEVPVATLLPGPGGTVWAGTYAGLVRYAPASGQLTVLGVADGLAELELNQQAAFRDPDGTLYFGGIGGLVRVRAAGPAGVASAVPRLLVTAVAHGAGAGQALPAGQLPELHLADTHAVGGFDLALTDFRAPDHNRFYYRVRGGEGRTGVVELTGYRLRLRGLAAGDYELDVWGQAASGQRTAPVRVALVVGRPWWQHPAALLAGALLLVGAGATWQRLRGQRALREARLRTRIAADLHDEVGALLTRVSMRAELLHETSPDPAAPDPAVAALLADSRTALATMRDVVWSIDAGADTVGALLDRLRDHLDQSAEAAGLRTSLEVSGLPDAGPLAPQVRQQLYLLAKEAITNAVRHAPGATEIRVGLHRVGRTLTLTVLNDGPVPAGRPGTGGLGLRSMRQRAEALGGQLTAGPLPAGGWQVRVVIG